MSPEFAEKMLPIFKNDMKKYSFKSSVIRSNGKYWNNKQPAFIRKVNRLTILFNVSKELFIECKKTLGHPTF